MINKPGPQPVDPESLAIRALSFLAADPTRLGRFLAATGIGPAEIRTAARDSSFLAGVLDHLADDESAMLAFAQEAGVSPDLIARARIALSGPPVERDVP